MLSSARILLAVAVAAAGTVSVAAPASAAPGQGAAGHYDHIFVIVEENHGYTDVIGNLSLIHI